MASRITHNSAPKTQNYLVTCRKHEPTLPWLYPTLDGTAGLAFVALSTAFTETLGLHKARRQYRGALRIRDGREAPLYSTASVQGSLKIAKSNDITPEELCQGF